ncbi:hypothetical protein ACN6LA_006844 [Streptomyces sp. SAS_269]|uniref:hypothetical protein n=1 Tax=Streptomyces sp. SAS_269 TaxID=3412749 RepID=UPI00403CEB25
MKDPVFVIHGVANRDRDEFASVVSALSTAADVDMVPVYWGDLGAQERFINTTLPVHRAEADVLRDGQDPEDLSVAPATAAMLAHTLDESQQLSHVDAAVREHLGTHGDEEPGGLRDHPGDHHLDPDQIVGYVREAWADTEWLSHTDDTQLLRETGSALARSLLDAADTDLDDAYYGLRGGRSDTNRGLRSLVRRRLNDLDRVAGAAVQAAGRRLNHTIRSRFGPGTTRLLGDVLVY